MRSSAINNFKNIELSKDEMEDIFIPEIKRVCQTCHKVRIKKRIDRRDFTPSHRRYICHYNQKK